MFHLTLDGSVSWTIISSNINAHYILKHPKLDEKFCYAKLNNSGMTYVAMSLYDKVLLSQSHYITVETLKGIVS